MQKKSEFWLLKKSLSLEVINGDHDVFEKNKIGQIGGISYSKKEEMTPKEIQICSTFPLKSSVCSGSLEICVQGELKIYIAKDP